MFEVTTFHSFSLSLYKVNRFTDQSDPPDLIPLTSPKPNNLPTTDQIDSCPAIIKARNTPDRRH